VTKNHRIGPFRANPHIRCVGIPFEHLKGAARADRGALIARISAETGLPCVDPIRDGTQAIIARLQAEFPE
jgi:uncharacterized NAD-dependent epimerase/dehydratase family protein